MLKTLILEDDLTKLRRIVEVLGDVTGFSVDTVTHVADFLSAKRLLASTYFDLLILDISVPVRADQQASPDAGLRLLNEITERPGYKVPAHIIGVTAYPEVYADAANDFSRRLLTVLLYDPASDGWVEPMQARVRHMLVSKQAQAQEADDYQCDLAIVCALRDSELPYVRRLSWDWEQVDLPDDNTIYYRGRYASEGTQKTVYAAACERMGLPAAAILTTKMIQRFRPRYVAMTGITAAVRGRAKYGDVIVADPVWDWGNGKWVSGPGSGSPIFLPAPHQIQLSAGLRKKFELFKDSGLLHRIREGWPADKPDHELSLHVGPVASGAAVLADGMTADAIKQQHRGLIGIEMESYALYAAAEEVSAPRPAAFALKAVVDYADGSKDDRYHKYAAYTSAEVLCHFAEAYL